MTDRILLSFDVEEFDIPREYGMPVDADALYDVSARGLVAVLDLLDRHGITATFFTTARFAEHRPDLVRRMAGKHELASHGYDHSRFEDADLARSRVTLQAVSNTTVIGFRRARLADTDPAKILDAGYRYDSSENPIYLPGRYNNLGKPRTAYITNGLVRIPVATTPIIRLPLFWLSFKNLPLGLYLHGCRRALGHDHALPLYFHPWEFTDLSAWKLPWYIRRHAGKPMLARLDKLINHLKPRGKFATYATFAEAVCGFDRHSEEEMFATDEHR